MTEYFQKNLFYNISFDEYRKLLSCLNARERHFLSGETICDFDKNFHSIGILGKGNALVVRYEVNGTRTILERLEPQGLFGQFISYQGNPLAGISVVSTSPCDVLFIDCDCISTPCSKACFHHSQLIRNLLSMISDRALHLSQRVEVLSQRSIREKLICYFLQFAGNQNSQEFSLPFTMVDLADYLSIDRSAMTREMKHMKEDGLIEVEKKRIRLHLEGI